MSGQKDCRTIITPFCHHSTIAHLTEMTQTRESAFYFSALPAESSRSSTVPENHGLILRDHSATPSPWTPDLVEGRGRKSLTEIKRIPL